MDRQQAENYASRLIKNRLRSAWQIDQALRRKEVADADRAAVVERLLAVGLLDDNRFARAWVHDRDLLAPRGKTVLRQELRTKGVAPEIIEAVLDRTTEANGEAPSEENQAAELVARRRERYRHLPPEVQKRRLAAYLQRRGFSAETTWRILNA